MKIMWENSDFKQQIFTFFMHEDFCNMNQLQQLFDKKLVEDLAHFLLGNEVENQYAEGR